MFDSILLYYLQYSTLADIIVLPYIDSYNFVNVDC